MSQVLPQFHTSIHRRQVPHLPLKHFDLHRPAFRTNFKFYSPHHFSSRNLIQLPSDSSNSRNSEVHQLSIHNFNHYRLFEVAIHGGILFVFLA